MKETARSAVTKPESGPYDDIISLPHPVSERRARMSLVDRGAQFSPFAALTGYDDAIRETARLTDQPVELDDSKKADIDRMIRKLQAHEQVHPKVSITCFCPDEWKPGGAYLTLTGRIRRISSYDQTICLEDGTRILFSSVVDMMGIDLDLEEE